MQIKYKTFANITAYIVNLFRRASLKQNFAIVLCSKLIMWHSFSTMVMLHDEIDRAVRANIFTPMVEIAKILVRKHIWTNGFTESHFNELPLQLSRISA